MSKAMIKRVAQLEAARKAELKASFLALYLFSHNTDERTRAFVRVFLSQVMNAEAIEKLCGAAQPDDAAIYAEVLPTIPIELLAPLDMIA